MGATGTLGSAVVRRLTAASGAADGRAGQVLGLARRRPPGMPPGASWAPADITRDSTADLAARFAGADAVIHLACLFQPARRPEVTWRTNVLGSERVFEAVAAAGVPALVHASSVVAYAPAPKGRRVTEDWPTHGTPTAAYCREKTYAERLLDAFEQRHPEVRVVRPRPALVLSRYSAARQRRLFGGPLVPAHGAVHAPPLLPDVPGLRFQALHAEDAAVALTRCALRPVRGAFNLAAEPPLDARELAALTGARAVRVPYRPVRAAVDAAWRLRLLSTPPGLLDAVLACPLMDTGRARRELDWRPAHSATEAAAALLAGPGDPP
ncbi:NAD-dependent epimerase/dehydratase family protein [Streptomyces sp. DSM 44917]|uniref:NAD-dependent epimerase/dehydratase family protein n=1 Tax=Streptomyces boetiae TaxID=3075541 RepID=A0ABU2LC24_9ACTN|nr:NAD-dependent epimerase/dehydratase family protein [Streptomyces sp. DSM 44917]MDT0308857.1 NAD-dependent epimerase/dehydratase family protein [Streptomyces sp. DSM 44917]